jgi:hypothetical protein
VVVKLIRPLGVPPVVPAHLPIAMLLLPVVLLNPAQRPKKLL